MAKTNLHRTIAAKIRYYRQKELVSSSAITLLMKVAGSVLGYVFVMLITRNFGADGMGIFSICTTVLTILVMISGAGMDTVVLRFVSEYSSQGRWEMARALYAQSLKLILPISIFFSVMLYLSAPFIARHIFNKELIVDHLRITSFAVIPSVILLVVAQALRALKKVKEYAFFIAVSNYLFACLFFIGLATINHRPMTTMISYVLATVVGALAGSWIWKRTLKYKTGPREKPMPIRELVQIAFPMLLSSSMLLMMHWTDTIMLGMYRSEGEVGVYNVAVRISAVSSITLLAITTIAAPKFAELFANNDMTGLETVVRQSSKLIFWSSAPIFLAILLFPSAILGIFGKDFRSGYQALLILTVGQVINAWSGAVGLILQMTGKQNTFKYLVMAATVLNICLNYLLIPRYGINGSAIATAVSVVTLNIICVVAVKKIYHINSVYFPAISR